MSSFRIRFVLVLIIAIIGENLCSHRPLYSQIQQKGFENETENLPSGHLLVSKSILNKYLVEKLELIVKYTLYNVGDLGVFEVELMDNTFEPDRYQLVAGKLNANIYFIPAKSNVSHVVVLRPVVAGVANFAPAEVRYKASSFSDAVQVGWSSQPREKRVLQFREYYWKYSSHVFDWITFGIMTMPSLLLPFVMWYLSKSKYDRIPVKNHLRKVKY